MWTDTMSAKRCRAAHLQLKAFLGPLLRACHDPCSSIASWRACCAINQKGAALHVCCRSVTPKSIQLWEETASTFVQVQGANAYHTCVADDHVEPLFLLYQVV